MKIKRPGQILLKSFGIIFAFLLICACWIYRPYQSYDPAQVIPELRNLKEPFQSVTSGYFLDGGSLGISIIDAEGSEISFCLPAPMRKSNDRYQRLFISADHYTDDAATEVPNPHHSNLKLVEILRAQSEINHQQDIVIASASGRWRDYITIYIRKLVTRRY